MLNESAYEDLAEEEDEINKIVAEEEKAKQPPQDSRYVARLVTANQVSETSIIPAVLGPFAVEVMPRNDLSDLVGGGKRAKTDVSQLEAGSYASGAFIDGTISESEFGVLCLIDDQSVAQYAPTLGQSNKPLPPPAPIHTHHPAPCKGPTPSPPSSSCDSDGMNLDDSKQAELENCNSSSMNGDFSASTSSSSSSSSSSSISSVIVIDQDGTPEEEPEEMNPLLSQLPNQEKEEKKKSGFDFHLRKRFRRKKPVRVITSRSNHTEDVKRVWKEQSQIYGLEEKCGIPQPPSTGYELEKTQIQTIPTDKNFRNFREIRGKQMMRSLGFDIAGATQHIYASSVDYYDEGWHFIQNPPVVVNPHTHEIDQSNTCCFLTIAGESGNGKTTYACAYVKKYLRLFPNNKVFLVRGTETKDLWDPESGMFNEAEQVRLKTVELYVCHLNPSEEYTNSLVVFDDIDHITNDPTAKRNSGNKHGQNIASLRNWILTNGRKFNVSCINIVHLLRQNALSRLYLRESHTITMFLAGNFPETEWLLRQRYRIETVKYIMEKALTTPWITIFRATRTSPQMLLTPTEFLLFG